ncbi:MAG TPA: pyridoxamine 5'-phosphate oxidase family protein [Actinomycetales bacterium]|nr:pyridoxamine 5'-phosphate oxidase family protein [Actinomycetales bacterium]
MLSSPVWFLWDAGTALVFSQPDTAKTRNLARNPSAGLHLNSDETGGHVVALEGTMAAGDEPDAETLARYLDKYRRGLGSLGMSDEQFRASYSVPLWFTPGRARVW